MQLGVNALGTRATGGGANVIAFVTFNLLTTVGSSNPLSPDWTVAATLSAPPSFAVNLSCIDIFVAPTLKLPILLVVWTADNSHKPIIDLELAANMYVNVPAIGPPSGGAFATIAANASLGATSITVTALTSEILAGDIFLINGKETVATANAAVGDTTVQVASLPVAATIGQSVNGTRYRVRRANRRLWPAPTLDAFGRPT